jgi:hypothetical protein
VCYKGGSKVLATMHINPEDREIVKGVEKKRKGQWSRVHFCGDSIGLRMDGLTLPLLT